MTTPNKNDTPLIIARGISKSPTRDGTKTITKLFFDAETMAQIVDQINAAVAGAEDGVSISVLEGEGKKGPYGMISVGSLQANPNRVPGAKRAYAPQANAAPVQAFTPPQAAVGGYKPKTPGYSKGFNK